MSLKTRLIQFSSLIANQMPLFAGLLLDFGTADEGYLLNLQAWVFLVIISLTWNVMRILLLRQRVSARSWLQVISIIICASLLALSLHVLRERTHESVFYLSLAMLILGALAEALEARKFSLLAVITFLLHQLSLSYLSSSIIIGHWLWQSLVFSLALSCLPTVLWLRMVIEKSEVAESSEISKSTHHFYIFCCLLMILCPLSISFLAVLGELPKHYALIVLTLPLIKSSLPSKRKLDQALLLHFLQSSRSFSGLISLVLIGLRLL